MWQFAKTNAKFMPNSYPWLLFIHCPCAPILLNGDIVGELKEEFHERSWNHASIFDRGHFIGCSFSKIIIDLYKPKCVVLLENSNVPLCLKCRHDSSQKESSTAIPMLVEGNIGVNKKYICMLD